MKKMKRGKAAGADRVGFELLKAGGESMITMLLKIFNAVWSQEKTPKDFSKMLVTTIQKKVTN